MKAALSFVWQQKKQKCLWRDRAGDLTATRFGGEKNSLRSNSFSLFSKPSWCQVPACALMALKFGSVYWHFPPLRFRKCVSGRTFCVFGKYLLRRTFDFDEGEI
ncbi:hypothetical protein HUK80_08100 [Flavobacterium sp. MAH-1]|uniref:Uncharacterized protein n=1 Tax=Flavobacterium agri TaxID=2743471 RepID=A0A7Y9C5C6_9FLAO|nr:hypothetical protein [Flavobacterium agri]NUY80851.1 hypothetical protein [Flavobacterium agri]NYA70875.1 hypothetical protein [Flavobacterium agri]